MTSYKWTMRLTEQDEIKIKQLKERYGIEKSSELIRYLLTKEMEKK